MRLLDICCGAGGAAKGYADVGFEVTGVDIRIQRHYPYNFVLADAMDILKDDLDGFDAIHASFPCQAYSPLSRFPSSTDKPDLIEEGRELLEKTGLPYVIENVPGAPLRNPVLFCGPAFGLEVIRHRIFEANFPLTSPGCMHRYGGTTKGLYIAFCGRNRDNEKWRNTPQRRGETEHKIAMGCDWMTRREARQAIPPVYTEHIGRQLLDYLEKNERDVA